MKYKKILKDEDIYVVLDASDTDIDSNTGKTQAVISYCQGNPNNWIILHEIHVELREAFTNSVINLEDNPSAAERRAAHMQACLEVSIEAYKQKGGIPERFNKIIAWKAHAPLRFTTIPRKQQN